jgi:hypothetical protein
VSLGRVSEMQVDPRDVIVEVDFSVPDRLNTVASAPSGSGIRDLLAWPQPSRQHGKVIQ